MTGNRYRIGFDIGETFTDVILHDGARSALRLHKLLTTPHDPAHAAMQGLTEICDTAGLALADVGELPHGTTLVTNAGSERKGAKLGLLTSAGFRGIPEMGFEQRYDIYNLFLDFPDPLVPRDLRLEVTERVDRDGTVVTRLDEGSVHTALGQMLDAGVQSVAVCFLHAYRNPAHDARLGYTLPQTLKETEDA